MIGSEAICENGVWIDERRVWGGCENVFDNFVLIHCSCFCVGLECEGHTLLPFREIL